MTTTNCKRCGAPLQAGGNLSGTCSRCLLELGLAGESQVVYTSSGAAAAEPPPTPEELAPHFPAHEILSIVGQGGMGVVYKARQKELDRLVAIKLLSGAAGRDPSFAERFAREARAMASLDHPNIVKVHDFGQAGGHYYLVMEYIDGANLRQMIRTAEISPRQALQVVGQICDSLQYAHEEGVVHRDIKPENILVDRRGRVKITDFGLAKMLGKQDDLAGLTRSRQVMGTPHYMAPEQVEHPRDVDHRVDIFSLGVVLYELLTGELPLGRFSPPSKVVEVDVRLDEVVLKALEKQPVHRYQTVGAMGTDVHTIGSVPATAEPVCCPPRKKPRTRVHHGGEPRRRSSGWAWALGCFGLLIMGALALAFLLAVGSTRYEQAAMAEQQAALSSEQAAVIARERAWGQSIFEDLDRGLDLSPAFIRDAGLEPEGEELLEQEISDLFYEYWALLTRRVEIEQSASGMVQIEVPAFAAELDGAVERFYQRVSNLDRQLAVLIRHQDRIRELFRFGRMPATVLIRSLPEGFAYSIHGGNRDESSEVFVPELPNDLQALWLTVQIPLPSSAQSHFAKILSLLEEMSTEEQQLRLSDLDIELMTRPIQDQIPVERYRVKLALEAIGTDSAASTALLREFLNRLQDILPCDSIATPSTDVVSDSPGIQADGISFDIQPASQWTFFGLDEPAQPTGIDVFMRGAFQGHELGPVNIRSRRKESHGMVDYVYASAPPRGGGQPSSLGLIAKALEHLEVGNDDTFVSAIELDHTGARSGALSDGWILNVALTARTPNGR